MSNQLDFEEKLWNIPKEQMKGQEGKKRPHTVPLTKPMLDLLKAIKQ